MIQPEPLPVTLVRLVECIPEPPPPTRRRRGHPKVYPDRLIIKALLRRLYTATSLLSFLDQETPLTQQWPEQLDRKRAFSLAPDVGPSPGSFARYTASVDWLFGMSLRVGRLPDEASIRTRMRG